jgi:glutamine cyclotransferase
MRRANATATQPEQLPPDDDPDTVLVVGSWTYAGNGWRTTADAAALALAAADAARSRRPTVSPAA